MRRGLDHLVMVAHELEAARMIYERLGFKTTPRAVHPFGTANFLVQFQHNFLELVEIDDASIIPPHTEDRFSFAAGNAAFLDRREGMSSLVFQSDNARSDRADFAAKRLNTYEVVDFSRKAGLPDGSEVTVSFSLAFLTDPMMPECTFFVCQQSNPEHFWKTEYQTHPNGALDAAETIMVAPDPAAHRPFFAGLHGNYNISQNAGGMFVETTQGSISLMRPAAFAERFGEDAAISGLGSPYFAGFRIQVADLDTLTGVLDGNNMPYSRDGDAVRIKHADTMGVAIEFTS
jgi:hypothetical protein